MLVFAPFSRLFDYVSVVLNFRRLLACCCFEPRRRLSDEEEEELSVSRALTRS